MTEANRQSEEKEERIVEIEIERLRPFKEHPFQVKDDKEMFLLQESIEGSNNAGLVSDFIEILGNVGDSFSSIKFPSLS